MNKFIAFCENSNCGTIFQATKIIGGQGSATIHMKGTRVGPCPRCGQFGLIPDGVYEYANKVISFLTGPSSSIENINAIKKILEKSKEDIRSKDEVLKEIESISPDTARIFGNAPDTKNYVHWLSILITLIMLAIQIHTSYFREDEKIEEKFIEHLLKENENIRDELREYRTDEKQIPYRKSGPKIKKMTLAHVVAVKNTKSVAVLPKYKS